MTIDGKWSVEGLAIGGELQPPLPGTEPTLEVEGDRVSGNATINRFMGALGEGQRPFGPLATTMMAGPEEHMAQERIYLGHLAAVESIEVEKDEMRLVLDGLIVVTLRRLGT